MTTKSNDVIVLIRDYDYPNREEYARRIAYYAHARGMRVLVAGDLALARRIGADGVHVAERLVGRLPRRLFAKPGFIVTAACHNEAAVRRANAHPLVSAILVSPVFETSSHPGRSGIGAVKLAELAGISQKPVYALGGVNPGRFRRLRGCRVAGFSMVSSWLQPV